MHWQLHDILAILKTTPECRHYWSEPSRSLASFRVYSENDVLVPQCVPSQKLTAQSGLGAEDMVIFQRAHAVHMLMSLSS